MRRLIAGEAEVVGRPDDAVAEVVRPKTIDEDSRRERVVGVSDPVGELAAAVGGE